MPLQPSECSREPLVEAILHFLGHDRATVFGDARTLIEREIDEAGPDAVRAMSETLARAGRDWQYYPADILARKIHHALAPHVLKNDSSVTGVEHLIHAASKPLIICANHLSYSDANVIDVLLRRSGAVAVAGMVTSCTVNNVVVAAPAVCVPSNAMLLEPSTSNSRITVFAGNPRLPMVVWVPEAAGFWTFRFPFVASIVYSVVVAGRSGPMLLV